MPVAMYPVNDLSDFIRVSTQIRQEWLKDEQVVPWFRGHRKTGWPLRPTLYRHGKASLKVESELREEFTTRAPTFSTIRPENEWEWYFMMQHYGLPTRLLDWTESALLGLFFALRDHRGYHDAAVWVLDPWWLNKVLIGTEEVLPPGAPGLTKKDGVRLDRWLPPRFAHGAKLPRWPIAIYPSHIDTRISRQKSCFTVHGTEIDGLEGLAARAGAAMARIQIPSFRVRAMTRELQTAGIDELSAFPSLDGLSKVLKGKWHTEKSATPHEHLLTRLRPSKDGGIGVFAIRKIKKGSVLFNGDSDEMTWVEESDVKRLPKAIYEIYEDFAVLRNGKYGCPPSFNRLTMAWHVNHSPKPNLRCDEDFDFVALNDIRVGEELTANYREYSQNRKDVGLP